MHRLSRPLAIETLAACSGTSLATRGDTVGREFVVVMGCHVTPRAVLLGHTHLVAGYSEGKAAKGKVGPLVIQAQKCFKKGIEVEVEGCASDRRGSGIHTQMLIAVFGLGLVITSFGCASSRVSNLEAYQEIPMSRVVPYPTEGELQKRAFDVEIVDRSSAELDEATLSEARTQVRHGLERIVRGAGAATFDPTFEDWSASSGAATTEADYILATRFLTYHYSSTWKKPFKFLWESPEDIAEKPGTCLHRVGVELDVQLIEAGGSGQVKKSYTLVHEVEQENKDLDPACTIAPVTLSVLFETAVEDSLSCLDRPLGSRLAPRGHILSHRKAAEAERHLYRVSLGTAQGLVEGDTVEILREQRSMSPGGVESRTERSLSLGRVSDKLLLEHAWVAIDPSKAEGEILEGDIVRPIRNEGLLSSLSGPNCNSILEEH